MKLKKVERSPFRKRMNVVSPNRSQKLKRSAAVRVADQEFMSWLHHLMNFLNSRLNYARQTMKRRPMENRWKWRILSLSLQLHWSRPSQRPRWARQQSKFQVNCQRAICSERLAFRCLPDQAFQSVHQRPNQQGTKSLRQRSSRETCPKRQSTPSLRALVHFSTSPLV